MGGSVGKEAGGSPMTAQGRFSTPKRQLPFDPRSPTDNITRTPIIVDSTPSDLLALDPRSPTFGIERTPLALLPGTDSSAAERMEVEMEASPQLTFANVRVRDSAPLCQPEDSSDANMMPHKPPPPPPLDLDHDPLEDIPHIDTEDLSPLLQSAVQPPLAKHEPTPLQSNRAVTLPKKLFSETQPAPALMAAGVKQAGVSRGLAARDANSPLNIVHNRQRRQVLMMKTMGRAGNHEGIDKENMAH